MRICSKPEMEVVQNWQFKATIVSKFCLVFYNHTAAPDGHSKSLDPHGQPLKSIYHGINLFLLGKYPGIYFYGAYPGIYTFYVNTWVYILCPKVYIFLPFSI